LAARLETVRLSGTYVYAADSTIDSVGRRDWIATASVGKKGPNLKDLEQRISIDASFLQDVRQLISPGSTLILTNAPVGTQTHSAPGFNILTADNRSTKNRFLSPIKPPHASSFSVQTYLLENILEAQSGPPPAPILRMLKRESGSEIDLQEVVLGSVNDIPSGFGEHSDVGREAIFESATKVA